MKCDKRWVGKGLILFVAAGCVGLLAGSVHADVPANQRVYSDRGMGSTGVFPAKGLVTEFWDIPAGFDMGMKVGRDGTVENYLPKADLTAGSQKNILWRVTLPNWGNNAPVTVGDRVFVMTEEGYKYDAPQLLCIDARTGKTLWQKSVDHLDTLPPDTQKTAKEARGMELARYRDYMKWWNRIYYDNEKQGIKPDEQREKEFPEMQKQAEAAGWLFQNPGYARGYKGPRSRFGISYRDGKRGGVPKDQKLIDNFRLVREKRWHLRQGWTTEEPWYGNTHGSVVSDGTTVFAVTGIGAVAAFDMRGNQRWLYWVNPEKNLRSDGTHGNLASPTLAGDTLVYFHRDSATLYGFEKDSGKVRFQTTSPTKESGHRDFRKFGHPLNYHGHIGPGSTPVILDLGGTVVTVTGNGMVVRVSDGKLLGMVEGEIHNYFDNAGAGDIYVYTSTGRDRGIAAVQLGLDGEKLTQKKLWGGLTTGNWEAGTSHAIHDGRVFVRLRGRGKGMTWVDATSGKILKGNGTAEREGFYGLGLEQYIARKSSRSETRFMAFELADNENLKTVGKGLLCEPPADGEIAARHIAFLGWPEIWTGYNKISCWGNRIFIRSNDYLWCIGDPKADYIPPEKFWE